MFLEKSFLAPHPGGMHKIAYSEFPGDPKRTILCVHGLSRNGRDFDWLAQTLALDGYRVICPDMAGRGRSDRLTDPTHYNYAQYLSDIQILLMEIAAPQVDWIGTSMGGLLGMMLAAPMGTFPGMPVISPIRRMVLNDVGPFITAAALQRIKDYVGMNPYYRDRASFADSFRKRFQTFGLKTQAEWDFLMSVSIEQDDTGRCRMNYDPMIVGGLSVATPLTDLDLWPVWEHIRQPLLLLHGADSDVLSHETLNRMMIGKQASAVSFADVGHAPALLSPDQITVLRTWLKDTPA